MPRLVKRITNRSCYFCENKKMPDYKDYQALNAFLSERSRIIGSKVTGVCSRHQKSLTQAIKRARHLGLLPQSSL